MRTTIFVILAALWVPASAHSLNSCDSLVITGHPAYPPVAWGLDSEIIGASAELVTSIAQQLKVKQIVSKNYGSWDKAQEAIKNGSADIIFGIYKNQERATYMNYIDPPYMLDPVSVVVRKGDSFQYEKWSDLKGHKGVTNQGESYGNEFDTYMNNELTVSRASDVNKAFDALLTNQADYLIIGLYPGYKESKQLNVISKVKFLPKALVTEKMYIAFSKKSDCYEPLKAGFSEGIKSSVASGKVKQLLETAEKRFNQ